MRVCRDRRNHRVFFLGAGGGGGDEVGGGGGGGGDELAGLDAFPEGVVGMIGLEPPEAGDIDVGGEV